MKNNKNTLRLYNDLAWLWPIWGSAEEYADYCRHVVRLIREHSQISVRSLLNLGCGGGKRKPDKVDLVFVENNYDPDPDDDHYEGTMVYLIREDGKLRVETDRHILGLFTLDVWRGILTEVGFRIHEETYVERDKEYVSFACLKPT